MAVEQSTLTAKRDTIETLLALKLGGTHDEFLLSLALVASPEQLEEAYAVASAHEYTALLQMVFDMHELDAEDLELVNVSSNSTGSSSTTPTTLDEVRG